MVDESNDYLPLRKILLACRWGVYYGKGIVCVYVCYPPEQFVVGLVSCT